MQHCKADSRDSYISDYKDDGTNILLDANENAYGSSLAGEMGASGEAVLDLTAMHRYPDPSVCPLDDSGPAITS